MSLIWKYFTLDSAESSTANCNVCKAKVSRGGCSISNYNTTNLIKHLQKHHAKEHTEFAQVKRKKDDPSKQMTLTDAFQSQKQMAQQSAKAVKITEKLLEFIVLDDQPLSVVENIGFRRLMEHLEPRYSLPSRKYISETALPELYSKVSSQIADKLKDVQSLSFTTDIWSSDVCPMSLLSLTAHWMDASYALQSAVLHVKELRGSHTSSVISASIKEMLDGWKIPIAKVHVILRDNASNMKKAMDDLGVPSLGCVAHTLQLVVNEGLLSQRSVSDVIASARKIVGHFKHSPLAYSRLQDLQREFQMPLKRLQQDVKTRWNSTYYMIQSILEQKRTLCAFAADHELPASMTANHWALLEKTMIVLSPFEELTRAISSSSSSTADVIPTISVLKRLLSQERDTDAGIKTMKSTLLQAVNTRFGNIEDEPLYSLATLLDPRYKDRCFTNEEAAMHAKNALIQEVEKIENALKTTATTALATAADPAEMVSHAEASGSSGHTSKSTFMMMFDEVLNKEQEESEGGIIQTSALVQVQTYMTEKLIPRSENPFQYWAVNNSRFPALAATASAFLSAPCTSVESERLFSTASNIIDEKRNRLLAERAEMLIFLKKNLTMFIK